MLLTTPQRTDEQIREIAAGGAAQQLFIDAANKRRDVTYVYSGDSTRDNLYSFANEYYVTQLGKLSITNIVNNASSGQSVQNWGNNVGLTTAAQAISAISGTGESSILEFSFGINDLKNGATAAQVKGWLKTGLDSLLTARPDLAIVLVVPVYTADLTRNVELQTIYVELASEYSLKLVDVLDIMGQVHGDPDYYEDGTHPNRSGTRRLLNFVLDSIVPASLSHLLTMPEYPSIAPIAAIVDSGYWDVGSGNAITLATWRRLEEIQIDGGQTLLITHAGNRTDCIFMDSSNSFIVKKNSTAVAGESYRQVIAPANAALMRCNVSSDGATYDALNDVPIVEYQVTAGILTVAEINEGLDLNSTTANQEGEYVDADQVREIINPIKYSNSFNGASSEADLDQTYILQNDGDYLEFRAVFRDYTTGNKGLAAFGLEGSSQTAVGWLNASTFWVRGDTGVGAAFALPITASPAALHTYRVELTPGNNVKLLIDGKEAGEVARPFTGVSINNVGHGYTSAIWADMDLDFFEIHGSADLTVTDMLDNSAVTPTNITKVIHEELDDFVVDVKAGVINIGVRQYDNIFIAYQFTHNPDPAKYSDVWRLSDVYQANGGAGALVLTRQFTTSGENETAIRITGSPDFMGGKRTEMRR